MSEKLTHIAIFASGAGSNAHQIIRHFTGSAKAKISLIVCNKPGAGILQIAEKEHIPTLLIQKELFFQGDAYVPELQKKGIDLIILAGFLWKIPPALIRLPGPDCQYSPCPSAQIWGQRDVWPPCASGSN